MMIVMTVVHTMKIHTVISDATAMTNVFVDISPTNPPVPTPPEPS